jgi:hypothetical protein
VGIDPVQTPQRKPRPDLAGMPNSHKSFMNFVPAKVRKVYIVDQIFVYVIDKYAGLFVDCRKNPRYFLGGAHDEEYLVTLGSQTVVEYIEGPRYVRMR